MGCPREGCNEVFEHFHDESGAVVFADLDSRGPHRTIVEVRDPTYENPSLYVKLSCGHEPQLNPIFMFRVGEAERCYACGLEVRAKVRP